MKDHHTTIRLSKTGRERLARLSLSYSSQTAAIEDALESLELAKVAFGQEVARATSRLISALQSGDVAEMGRAQMALAELLNSVPAATGIMGAIEQFLKDRPQTP